MNKQHPIIQAHKKMITAAEELRQLPNLSEHSKKVLSLIDKKESELNGS